MSFLRKFKISVRLAAMNVTLIVFTIIMCSIGLFNITNISGSTNIIFNKEVRSLTYLQKIRESFLKVGSSLRDIALTSGGEGGKEELEEKIRTIQSHYMDMADDVINFTKTLEKFEGTDNDVANIKTIESLIENDYRAVVNELIKAARDGGDSAALNGILSTGTHTSNTLESLITTMYNENLSYIRLAQKNSQDTVTTTRTSMIALNIIILAVSIIMGNFITRSVTRPIKKLLSAASKITMGDFETEIESTYKDEVGNLSKSFSNLINTVRELIFEMEQMADKQAGGDFDAVIDETKFAGSYLKVAQGTNKMMTDLINDVLSMTECLTEFGNGNFSADIPQFQNKKAVINHGINELRTNLTVVSDEINSLVKFATSGDLKKRADFTKYSGDWSKIIIGLNNLLEAVVVPINEASSALKMFSQGNLNACMEGEYEGDFASIKQSINMTVSTISSYMVEIDSVLGKLINNKDFNVSIEREYIGDFVTIKENINKIVCTFNGIISQINDASLEVSDDAQQISDLSIALSNGTLTQSTMVDKLNDEMDMLNKQTVNNAENSKKASTFAITANESAASANKEMENMLEAMSEISKASIDISNINKVVNDISFQTNLLALNASIEAARAGVHGKGFSVVADEVRNLANKSNEAADQTNAIIEQTLQKVNDGSIMANKTAKALEEIENQISAISSLISEIDTSSNTQASNINQIYQDIGNILQIAKEAKTSSEAARQCSEELSKQSDSLKAMVDEFNLRGAIGTV